MACLIGYAQRIRPYSRLICFSLAFTGQFACTSSSATRQPAKSGALLAKNATVDANEESAGVSVLFSLCGLTAVGNQDDAHFRLGLEGAKVSVARGEAGHRDLLLVDG
jgi:hypothetical protein